MAPGNIASFVKPTACDDPRSKARCKIGINGFGRIDRCVFRASLERQDLEVVAINHSCASYDLIHLILLANGNLYFDGREITLSLERDLSLLNWSVAGAQYIAEYTGKTRGYLSTSKSTSLTKIVSAYRLAAKTSLTGVLSVTEAELVSSDFLCHPCSAVIDVHACVELNSRFFKIIAWHDNEWAYSSRLLDLLAMMPKRDFET